MITVGNMLWRIGTILDIGEQIEWSREAGFRGIGLHAHPGNPEQWRGLDPLQTDLRARKQWRDRLSDFDWVEIHSPFATKITSERLDDAASELTEVIKFAHDLGASVVTVHGEIPPTLAGADADAMYATMRDIDHVAESSGVMVGLEIDEGYGVVREWELPNVGITFDIGHWIMWHNRGGGQEYSGFGDVIRDIGSNLAHMHMHDVLNGVDHIEVGAGEIDYQEIACALREISYERGMCLEMNPTRVSPDGIERSLEKLHAFLQDASILDTEGKS